MKHLRLFESMTEIEVEKICKKYNIRNWTLNTDGTVDVDGNVGISGQRLSKLPLKFGRVTGDFFCSYSKLTSLEGCPTQIGGSFWCHDNQLTSLKGAPEYIEGKVEFMPNDKLPEYIKQILKLNDGSRDIQKYILKWQKDYDVWRRDGSFNQDRFIQMMQDASDELPKLKLPE